MKVYIGCSGYHYADWKKKFYPEDLPKKEWLKYYTDHFNTVEINNTFYKMPVKKDLENWKKETPSDFRFTLKANRFFTHQKKLKIDHDFRDRFEDFMKVSETLGNKLGCILWQLPGNLHKNVSKVEELCRLVDKTYRHVIEFRHKSWFDEEIYEILNKYNVTFCILSAPDELPEECRATANTGYLRLHGKKEWYKYNYTDDELKTWSTRLKELKNVEQLFVYFNNDQNANAVENAKTMKSYFD